MVESIVNALANMVYETAKALKLNHIHIEFYSDEWCADLGKPPISVWLTDEENNTYRAEGGNDE